MGSVIPFQKDKNYANETSDAFNTRTQNMAKGMNVIGDVKGDHALTNLQPGGIQTHLENDHFTHNISAPQGTKNSVVAYELGHAKNYNALGLRGMKALSKVNKFAKPATEVAAGLALSQDDPSYTPGIAALAANTPQLLDEGIATGRALKYLRGQTGSWGGALKQSLPLATGFASYLGAASAPLGITAIRKRLASNVPQEQVPVNS